MTGPPRTPSPYLLSKIRCPATRAQLALRDGFLVAGEGGRCYAVTEDGIPDLFAPSADGDQRKVEEANAAFHDGHAEVYDRQTVRPEEDYTVVTETL